MCAGQAGECARCSDGDPATAARKLANLDSVRASLPEPVASAMHSLRTRLQTVFEEVAAQAARVKALEGDLSASQADAAAAREALSAAQAQLGELGRELAALRQQYGWKEQELADVRAKSAAAIDELQRQLQVPQPILPPSPRLQPMPFPVSHLRRILHLAHHRGLSVPASIYFPTALYIEFTTRTYTSRL